MEIKNNIELKINQFFKNYFKNLKTSIEMNIKYFFTELNNLKPNIENLIKSGYSKDTAEKIIKKEFLIQDFSHLEISTSIFKDFINYNRFNSFRILNLFFNKELIEDIIDGHIIFGFIDGGYISYEKKTGYFHCSYADDLSGSLSKICENENQFFKILLIVADYSSKSYQGMLPENDESALENYIDKCRDIYLSGEFTPLFS